MGNNSNFQEKKTQQTKFWDVMKNMDLKGAFLLYKPSKETESWANRDYSYIC